MILRKGDKGQNIIELQKALDRAGFWPKDVKYSVNFGSTTDQAVRDYQKANGLIVDGKVGEKTLEELSVYIEKKSSGFDEKYKNVTIQGSIFPDAPIKKYVIRLNPEMVNEYVPIVKTLGLTKGFEFLITAMAYKEGYRKGTRSYKHRNPGNIGNTDNGSNQTSSTLKDGIKKQVNYINSIVNGKHKSFPMNKEVNIKPAFSAEIAKNSKVYGMSPWLPGYHFVFTGQLDQFAKIYATGARAGNTYISTIISYFKQQGIIITAQSKIQDIIKMI